MTQNTGVQKLVDLLADYYPSANDARSVIIRAGIPAKFIDFNGSSIVIWTYIFQEAEKRNKLADLIATINQDYPKTDWSAIQQNIEQPINYAPVIGKDIPWKGPDDLSTLEKIIEQQVINLNNTQKDKLAELLLKCPRMNDSQKEVLARLSDEIRNNIKSSSIPIVHMVNIVETCNNYENGIIQLIHAIKRFEGNSKPMQNIERFIKML